MAEEAKGLITMMTTPTEDQKVMRPTMIQGPQGQVIVTDQTTYTALKLLKVARHIETCTCVYCKNARVAWKMHLETGSPFQKSSD